MNATIGELGETAMKIVCTFIAACAAATALASDEPPITLESAPPVVVKTVPAAIYGASRQVETTGMWSGKVKDKTLSTLAPQSGFVADAKTWTTLWTAWRPGEELPKVDFAQELILVGVVPGPNLVIMRPTINDNGDVKFTVGGTKIGGGGFGYKLLKIGRAGVKTINGKSVAAKNPASENPTSVTIVGALRTGVFAVGGETTGTTVTANGVTWELDFGKNAALRKAAEKLRGKKVAVQGRLERRHGVEVKERRIVTVTALRSAD